MSSFVGFLVVVSIGSVLAQLPAQCTMGMPCPISTTGLTGVCISGFVGAVCLPASSSFCQTAAANAVCSPEGFPPMAGKCQNLLGYPACFPNNIVPCNTVGEACTYDNAPGKCADVLGMKYCLPSNVATIAPCTSGTACVNDKGQKGTCIGVGGVFACFVDQATTGGGVGGGTTAPPQPSPTPVMGGGTTGPKTWAPGPSTTTLPPSPPCGSDGYGAGVMCVTNGVGGTCGMDKNGQWFCAATSLKCTTGLVCEVDGKAGKCQYKSPTENVCVANPLVSRCMLGEYCVAVGNYPGKCQNVADGTACVATSSDPITMPKSSSTVVVALNVLLSVFATIIALI